MACAVLVALLAAAGAWALRMGMAAPHHVPSPTVRTVELGVASVTVPAGWAPVRVAAAGVPVPTRHTAVLAPAPGLSAYAIVVLAPTLPAALRELIGPRGPGRSTTLAGLPALAYGARPVSKGRVAELTVTKTGSGLLAVACLAPSTSWTGAAGCAEQIGRSAGSTLEPAG